MRQVDESIVKGAPFCSVDMGVATQNLAIRKWRSIRYFSEQVVSDELLSRVKVVSSWNIGIWGKCTDLATLYVHKEREVMNCSRVIVKNQLHVVLHVCVCNLCLVWGWKQFDCISLHGQQSNADYSCLVSFDNRVGMLTTNSTRNLSGS